MKSWEKEIPHPIYINCWKHHAGFIKKHIKETVKKGKRSFKPLLSELIVLGDSLIDLYLGLLSPTIVANHIVDELKQRNVFEKKLYKEYLSEDSNDYQLLTLTDTSNWTLRLSKETIRYVHIHPARYSPFTIRVRSLSLKTAIAVIVYSKLYGGSPLDVEIVNKVRKELLKVSPIKSVSHSSVFGELILSLADD